MKYTWVVYGLDMEGIQTIETEGIDMNESHGKAVEYFNNSDLDWDSCELYKDYLKGTMKEEDFIQEYIEDVIQDLQNYYHIDENEAHKLLEGSAFLTTMERDPEYVINHNTEYWAERIYTTRAKAMNDKQKELTTMQRLKLHLDENGKEYYEKIQEETNRILENEKK